MAGLVPAIHVGPRARFRAFGYMIRHRTLPVALLAIALFGCGHIERKQVDEGEFEITGWRYAANDQDFKREAVAACPLGWDSLAVEHSRVAEGQVWTWRIRCWLDDD